MKHTQELTGRGRTSASPHGEEAQRGEGTLLAPGTRYLGPVAGAQHTSFLFHSLWRADLGLKPRTSDLCPVLLALLGAAFRELLLYMGCNP